MATITALSSRTRPRQSRIAEPQEILDFVLKTLDDGKAEDIVTIDLAGKTTIADYMVIASGRSARQVTALTEHLEEALSGRIKIAIEGKEQGDWVLIDASDVIVHLFRPEIRAYYNLEKMWGVGIPQRRSGAAIARDASNPASHSRDRPATLRAVKGASRALRRADRAAADDHRA